MNSSRRKSLRTPSRKKRSRPNEGEENGSVPVMANKRKSLRLQHSMSLHIPLQDLESSDVHMNCYIDLPQQAFCLTYLEVNNTQNPDTLEALEVFKKGQWQAYLVGHVYNFEPTETCLSHLARVLNNALSCEYQNVMRGVKFEVEITLSDHLSPTDNDNRAVVIEITQVNEEKQTVVYKGYLISWCCPTPVKGVFYPLLLCAGSAKYQTTINAVLSERLDVCISKLTLSQDELVHLSTYCLIMLSDNDTHSAKFTYEIPHVGTLQVHQPVAKLISIWKMIREDDNIEVDLNDVVTFSHELELFLESTFGIVFSSTLLQCFEVSKCVTLQRICQMKFRSTRIIHVVFKYLNYLATKRLKLSVLGLTEESQTERSSV